MANYIVTYDLNGSIPSHATMDKHMGDAGWDRGRILETVWYVGTPDSLRTVYDHVNSVLSGNDQVIVVLADRAVFRNLLISDDSLLAAWSANN